MSQPLYFLPGIDRESLGTGGKLSRDVLQARGLATVFADVQAIGVDAGAGNITHGPDGRSGCILYYVTPDGKIPQNTSYVPQAQTWHAVNEGLYIGVANDAMPTEADLRRKKMSPWVAPIGVDMGGAEWTIPVIRRVDGMTSLPTQLLLTEAGELQKPVHPSYRDLWERFKDVADWALSESIQLPEALLLRRAIDAVSVNYRYGLHEQNVLRFIDSEAWSQILFLAVDKWGADALADAQKKTASTPQDGITTAGSVDSSAITLPALENATQPPLESEASQP